MKYKPRKRVNPSGKVVWQARYKDRSGQWHIAKPHWNDFKGTFALKRDAQRAIDEAVAMPDRQGTIREFATVWLDKYPRSERTNQNYRGRVKAVLDVPIEGLKLGDWPMHELKRRHATELVDHMLRVQKRAAAGAVGILRALSALMEDAINEDLVGSNPFRGVRIRANDKRIVKKAKKIQTWTLDQMVEFASAGRAETRAKTRRADFEEKVREKKKAGTLKHGEPEEFYSEIDYEPMLLAFPLTGMRLGEILGLHKNQLVQGMFMLGGTAWNGRYIAGDTEEKIHVRPVPCPLRLEIAILDRPQGPDGSKILFPTPKGTIFSASNFYRQVWTAAQLASGLPITPHECRHSFLSILRSEGIDDADLAQIAGHRVETMVAHYIHPTNRSWDRVKELLG